MKSTDIDIGASCKRSPKGKFITFYSQCPIGDSIRFISIKSIDEKGNEVEYFKDRKNNLWEFVGSLGCKNYPNCVEVGCCPFGGNFYLVGDDYIVFGGYDFLEPMDIRGVDDIKVWADYLNWMEQPNRKELYEMLTPRLTVSNWID